jgi:hypothetical protein
MTRHTGVSLGEGVVAGQSVAVSSVIRLGAGTPRAVSRSRSPVDSVGPGFPVLADAGFYACHGASFSWSEGMPKGIQEIVRRA